MTQELFFEKQGLSEVTQELNEKLGNSPYKILEEENGLRVLIPEGEEDPLDLFNEEIDALDEITEAYLKTLNMEGELGFDVLGQTIWINIDGPDAGFFLKNRGDLLNDLQFMLEVYLNKKFPGLKAYVKCDAEARRRGNIDNMLDLAQKKAQHAIDSGESQKLPPMNAYERRVIHLSLLPVQGVTTRSHGMGSLKQVIIAPEPQQEGVSEE